MRYGLGVVVVGLLLVVGACSSDSDDAAPPPATTTTTSAAPTSSSSTATAPVSTASTETVQACRALADDQELAAYWEKVSAGGADASASVSAANAIRSLEVYLPTPGVEPTVVDAVKAATDAVAADGTLPGRPEEFRAVVTPIVNACIAADVDMEVS